MMSIFINQNNLIKQALLNTIIFIILHKIYILSIFG
jgi:hypothetical protein